MPDSAHSTKSNSTWFEDEHTLLDVVRGDAVITTPVIHGYHSLRELKRGGQGVVFRARQQSTSRDVAVKVLLAGSLATPGSRRRFEREAELAASLRHPNIVRIFDCGVTPEGTPYLIMELVEGGPFVTGDHPPDAPTLRSRIAAMLKVVEAVGHAHQRGVLHRDLKPGNIRIDESGEPRVLDFGLAKAIAEAPTEAKTFAVSMTGQLVGSLPWMSPEQLDDPAAIDTRTDIYSVGVILHQLATAALPYDTSGTLASAIHNIRTVTPPLASALNPAANADLSTIIARCLAKDRERRYPSAAELQADLAAWLAEEPIRARRDSGWYTLRKKASRYRAVAWVGGSSAAALAAAALVSVNAAARASRERDIATAALRRAETVTDVLVKMIVSPDPTKDGRDVRVIDVLDEASRNADTAFAADAASEVGVRLALSQSYTALGQAEAGLREAERAGTRLDENAAPADRVSVDSSAAAALHELGRQAEALPRARSAYDRAVASFSEHDDRIT
ncbi:MAG: serine/threonine-protein kinase, partial [bacterium]|nr:serine/threonine-protein kinase [bacterium]